MPIGQRGDVLGKTWLDCDDGLAQRLQSCCTHLLVSPLRKDVAHLPIIEAVEDCQHTPIGKTPSNTPFITPWIFGQVRQPEPENIHRWRSLNHFEPGKMAQLREPSIGTSRQQRTHFVPSINALVTNAANRSVLLD